MGHTSSNETAALLPHQLTSKPLKFPLGLASEGVRPYLELIRLEKVRHLATVSVIYYEPAYLLLSTAHRNDSYVLAFRSDLSDSILDAN